MTAINLVLAPICGEDNLNNVFIGDSCFTNDIWDLSAFVTIKSLAFSRQIVDFSYIKNERIKYTVKKYAYFKLSLVKPQTVCTYINGFLRAFIQYATENNIESFSDITKEKFLGFSLWLKDFKQVKTCTGFHYAHIIEDIIKSGQIMGWDVPMENIFLSFTTNDLWNTSKELRTNKTKPIPEDIFDNILFHALHDENNICIKAGIIIMSQTGLRLNEILSIQEGSIHTNSDGVKYLEFALSKTERGKPANHKVFVNQLVVDAVNELSESKAKLRDESGMNELFLCRQSRQINVMKTVSFRNGLTKFIRRCKIIDSTGELYQLKPHQFRATFVRELIKQKVPIAFIMKQYGHVSIEMTAHYLTLQEAEIKEIYSDMIFSPTSKIVGLRAEEIRGKLNTKYKGKTQNEIEQVISELSNSMSFNPLPTGVCLYDFRRGNCSDGDGCFMYNCPNYLTEVRFYPILRAELDLMETEMKRLKELGQLPAWQVQYVKWKFLKPLVENLAEQMGSNVNV